MVNQEAYESALKSCGWEDESWKAYKLVEEYEQAKLDKAVAKDTTAKDFIEEITKAGGKYSYLNNTPIVADAYAILRELISSDKTDKSIVRLIIEAYEQAKLSKNLDKISNVLDKNLDKEPPKVPEKIAIEDLYLTPAEDRIEVVRVKINEILSYLMNKGER